MTGELYLCATPIGNLEDITLRALRILKEVDLIAAEDTRQSKKLCNHYAINTPLTSYHEHNKDSKGAYLIDLLLAGKKIALVSDAGMPGISDPGYELVCLAIEQGIKIIPLPGPVAAISALVVSGLPTDAFTFIGFLSRSGKKRKAMLLDLTKEQRTLIFYEAPHRLQKTLKDFRQIFGNRDIVVAREITKRYEEIWRGTIEGGMAHFSEPKGEITLLLAGCTEEVVAEYEGTVLDEVESLLCQGMEKMICFKMVAKNRKMSKREVYELYLQKKKADVD